MEDATGKVEFSAADYEQLVKLVARHQILWNMAAKYFKTHKKDLIWKEIARMLSTTGMLLN